VTELTDLALGHVQGVGVATVTDLQLNFMGSLMSLCAVATTCISQIWTNTLQKRFSISSTQLLYNYAPYQVAHRAQLYSSSQLVQPYSSSQWP
jgi:solute carrier family 35 protein E3